MTVDSNLQFVFNDILSGASKTILFSDKAAYESVRTALLRKFRKYRLLLNDLGGADPFDGRFLRCSWDKEECTGTFHIELDERRTNNPNKVLKTVEEL